MPTTRYSTLHKSGGYYTALIYPDCDSQHGKMPSPATNSRNFFIFLRSALHVGPDCRCEDCTDAMSGRSQLTQLLGSIITPGRGCPMKRGGRALLGMLMKRELSLDPRLLTRPLIKLVDILRQARDPVTARAVWALLEHFQYHNSPVHNVHQVGHDYYYDENLRLVWTMGPLNSELSEARRDEIRELRRLDIETFTEIYHDIPLTRLDQEFWNCESQTN